MGLDRLTLASIWVAISAFGDVPYRGGGDGCQGPVTIDVRYSATEADGEQPGRTAEIVRRVMLEAASEWSGKQEVGLAACRPKRGRFPHVPRVHAVLRLGHRTVSIAHLGNLDTAGTGRFVPFGVGGKSSEVPGAGILGLVSGGSAAGWFSVMTSLYTERADPNRAAGRPPVQNSSVQNYVNLLVPIRRSASQPDRMGL